MTSPVPAPEHPPVRTADGKLGADIPARDPPQREQDLGRIYDATEQSMVYDPSLTIRERASGLGSRTDAEAAG